LLTTLSFSPQVAGITADANILVNSCRLAAQRYLFTYQVRGRVLVAAGTGTLKGGRRAAKLPAPASGDGGQLT